MSEHKEELQELKHDAWPGYRKVFIIVFALGALYLLWIFLGTPLDEIDLYPH